MCTLIDKFDEHDGKIIVSRRKFKKDTSIYCPLEYFKPCLTIILLGLNNVEGIELDDPE